MKRTILSMALFTCMANADLSVSQIQKMVTQIHKKRNGIDLKTLENTKEPFVHIAVEENTTTYVAPEKKEIELALHAILNHKAYINENWYKVDDDVLGYRLKYIGKKGVVLRNENHIKKLFLHEKKDTYIIIDKKE